MHARSEHDQKRRRALIALVTGIVALIAVVVAVQMITDDDDEPSLGDTTVTDDTADDSAGDTADDPVADDATDDPGDDPADDGTEPVDDPVGEPTTEPTDDTDDSTADPVATELVAEPARYWQVTGVDNDINVRAEPGTDAAVVTTLPADTQAVRATGARVEVDGAEWKQVLLADGTSGFVLAQYLAPAGRPRPTNPGWTCWLGQVEGGYASVLIDESTEPIDGIIRFDVAGRADFQYLRLERRADGDLDVSSSGSDNTQRTVVWSNPGGTIVTDQGVSLGSVACDDIGGYVDDMVDLWATE